MLRTLLYEAAQVLLTRVKKWSRLKAWAVNVARSTMLFVVKATTVLRRRLRGHRVERDAMVHKHPAAREAR